MLSYRWTALHEACNCGSQQLLKIFIDNGADVRIKTKDGLTPKDIVLKRIERK